MVTLSYVDSGFETSSHFVSHLGAYQGLFRQLKSFRFLYIAAKDAYFQKAEERFRSLVKRPLESDVSGEILRYFQVRRKWERHEYIVPVADDLEFLKEGRRRFQADRFEGLYQDWCTGTITERDLRLEFSQLKPDPPVFFGTFLRSCWEHRGCACRDGTQAENDVGTLFPHGRGTRTETPRSGDNRCRVRDSCL